MVKTRIIVSIIISLGILGALIKRDIDRAEKINIFRIISEFCISLFIVGVLNAITIGFKYLGIFAGTTVGMGILVSVPLIVRHKEWENNINEIIETFSLVATLAGLVVIAFIATDYSDMKDEENLKKLAEERNKAEVIIDEGEYNLNDNIIVNAEYNVRIAEVNIGNAFVYKPAEYIDNSAALDIYMPNAALTKSPDGEERYTIYSEKPSIEREYYATAGNKYVDIAYYIDNGISLANNNAPSIYIETLNGEKYNQLNQITDAHQNYEKLNFYTYNQDNTKIRHAVFQIPDRALDTKEMYLYVSDKYIPGTTLTVKKYIYYFD